MARGRKKILDRIRPRCMQDTVSRDEMERDGGNGRRCGMVENSS